MAQALSRRYTRRKWRQAVSDLLMVDGGKGQLAEAIRVLDELQIEGLEVLAVAKGRTAQAGSGATVLGREKTRPYCRATPRLCV